MLVSILDHRSLFVIVGLTVTLLRGRMGLNLLGLDLEQLVAGVVTEFIQKV